MHVQCSLGTGVNHSVLRDAGFRAGHFPKQPNLSILTGNWRLFRKEAHHLEYNKELIEM